jgi:hypothetical protein
MTKNRLWMSLICLTLTAAAPQPGLIATGHMETRDGWQFDYSTFVKPAISGQRMSLLSGASVTQAKRGRPAVFHRYLGDVSAKVYFGYDVVLEPSGASMRLRFAPISKSPEEWLGEQWSPGARMLAIQEFPSRTFESGQNIAITLLADPTTGQKVVDYIHVDTSLFDLFHHVIGNMITAFHRHFEAHNPPTVEPDLKPVR